MQLSLQSFQQKTSWLTTERKNWAAAVLMACAVGYGLGNGHTTQNAISHVSMQLGDKKAVIKKLETVDIPKIKAVAGCQAVKADVTSQVDQGAAERSDIPICPPPSSVASLGHR